MFFCPTPTLLTTIIPPEKKGLVLRSTSCFDGSKASMKERLFGTNGVYLLAKRLRSLPGNVAAVSKRERARESKIAFL